MSALADLLVFDATTRAVLEDIDARRFACRREYERRIEALNAERDAHYEKRSQLLALVKREEGAA
jgi:hypothetical protein